MWLFFRERKCSKKWIWCQQVSEPCRDTWGGQALLLERTSNWRSYSQTITNHSDSASTHESSLPAIWLTGSADVTKTTCHGFPLLFGFWLTSSTHSGVLYRNVSASNTLVYVRAMTTEKDLRFSHAVKCWFTFCRSRPCPVCYISINPWGESSCFQECRRSGSASIISEMQTCPDGSVCIMGNVKQSAIWRG